MELDFVPLLQLQRDLYNIPPQERFNAYLKAMLKADGSDVALPPFQAMNPMGKAHVVEMLDALLAMEADVVAAEAIAQIQNSLKEISGTFQIGLVVVDDLMGGWTNRYTTEFSDRFQTEHSFNRGWLSAPLWTSETPFRSVVREATLTAAYRAAYIQQYGFAQTLQEMLNQEGYAMAMADCERPRLDEADMTYTHEVMLPHFQTQDQPMIMACLFGDRAAHSLGYEPQGLSERAGFALALHQAQQQMPNRHAD
ncbi:MAG: hypothetical protein AAGJ95_11270 [Cyanobacteria bacterium J06554_11]